MSDAQERARQVSMREIKFRAWDKERKEMDYRDWESLTRWGWIKIATTYLDVMQFTGLKDKNDKEIYEGDIIDFRYDYWDSYRKTTYEIVGKSKVRFVRSAFCIQMKIRDIGPTWKELPVVGSDAEETEHIEILGNIYENPELLKEVK